ncbi:DUF1543 domain-containing protein [Sphingobacterium cellulitidis]|uniref:DUF1543 domain-containing protein n=1 Tax=Sphingobacterium cellulitidis TaxID=1768011 RepID=UPI000B93D305|nr:hypothetical protein CHT99_15035 [Sphingobacterium cellulitidis]
MDLFMIVIGGKPVGRFTEQHDVFFGIANSLKDLVPQMNEFWPALEGKMHIDSWRKVSQVATHKIEVLPKSESKLADSAKLFFVNLGGYKPNDMEEYHYKQLVVAKDLAEATKVAKDTVFWKHHESSHIDDKYGIDVDDIYEVSDMLSSTLKDKYQIQIVPHTEGVEDPLEVGYLKISKLMEQNLQQG